MSIRLRRYFILLILLFMTGPVPSLSAQEDDVTSKTHRTKHPFIKGHKFPCHILNFQYADSYPMVNVLADVSTLAAAEGKLSSSEYQNSMFLPIHKQRRGGAGGRKRYFLEATNVSFRKLAQTNFNFSNVDNLTQSGKHIGFISFDAETKIEAYKEEKHGLWPLRRDLDGLDEVIGTAEVYPIRKIYSETRQYSAGTNVGTYSQVHDLVIYDECTYSGGLHITAAASLAAYKIAYPYFPFKSAKNYQGANHLYTPDETPTFFGYVFQTNESYSNALQSFDNTVNSMIFIRDTAFSILPVVGTAISAHHCYTKGDALDICGYNVAGDLVGDALFVGAVYLKLAGGANLAWKATRMAQGTTSASAKTIIRTAQKAAAAGLFAFGGYNVGLSAIYASHKDWLNAGLRLGAGAGDLIQSAIIRPRRQGGLVEVEIGVVPKKPIDTPNSDPQASLTTTAIDDQPLPRELLPDRLTMANSKPIDILEESVDSLDKKRLLDFLKERYRDFHANGIPSAENLVNPSGISNKLSFHNTTLNAIRKIFFGKKKGIRPIDKFGIDFNSGSPTVISHGAGGSGEVTLIFYKSDLKPMNPLNPLENGVGGGRVTTDIFSEIPQKSDGVPVENIAAIAVRRSKGNTWQIAWKNPNYSSRLNQDLHPLASSRINPAAIKAIPGDSKIARTTIERDELADLFERADRMDGTADGISGTYANMLDQLLTGEVVTPHTADKLAKQFADTLESLGVKHVTRTPITPYPYAIDEVKLALIRQLSDLEDKATLVNAFKNNPAYESSYSPVTLEIEVLPPLAIKKTNGKIETIAQLDPEDEGLEMLLYAQNHSHAEELTHALQDRLNKNLQGDWPIELEIFPETREFLDWYASPAASNTKMADILGTDISNIERLRAVDFNKPEVDPLILYTRTADTPAKLAYAREAFLTTTYRSRLFYAVQRQMNNESFLGLKGEELIEFLRGHPLLEAS